MADAEIHTDRSIRPATFMLTGSAEHLRKWVQPEPKYKYIFAVKIIDTDWQNLKCEVRFKRTSVTSQAKLEQSDYDDTVINGTLLNSNALNISLYADEPSLVIFYLDENGATFEDQYHPNLAEYVILRKYGQQHLIYQASWLAKATDRKAISVIMRGHKATDYAISYGLKVRTEQGGSVTYNDIDPKIENEGEGGGGVPGARASGAVS